MRDELKSIRKGYTWRDMFFALWHIATVRYVTAGQLKKYYPDTLWRIKCGTEGKLELFASEGVGLLRKKGNGVYTAAPKTIEFLRSELKIWQEERQAKDELAEWRDEELRYNPDIIELGGGEGKKDTLYNSAVLLQAMQRRDFLAVFYHTFSDSKGSPWLTPDGVMLLRRKDRLALIFLEIEKEKPLWRDHIEGKKWKYEKLAQEEWLWSDWWKIKCAQLKIDHCGKEEFGFNVWCIGDIRQEDWPGWQFKSEIV